MIDYIVNNKYHIADFLFIYGVIISSIAFIGIPFIVLKNIIKQKKYTKFNYILLNIFLSGFISVWLFIDATKTGIQDVNYLFLYSFFMWFTIFSLICFICLITVHIVKKIKYNNFEKILLILCILGIYSYIPRFLIHKIPSEKYLTIGTKMAIIPFDKQTGYLHLGKKADINARQTHSQEDYYKAIKYYEKAISGKYSKYLTDVDSLITLYISVGDYDKALKTINKAENNKIGYAFDSLKTDVYILHGKYSEAIEILLKTNDVNSNEYKLFLIAALYNEIGDKNRTNIYLTKAQKIYNEKIHNNEYKTVYINDINKYKTIQTYKNKLIKTTY